MISGNQIKYHIYSLEANGMWRPRWRPIVDKPLCQSAPPRQDEGGINDQNFLFMNIVLFPNHRHKLYIKLYCINGFNRREKPSARDPSYSVYSNEILCTVGSVLGILMDRSPSLSCPLILVASYFESSEKLRLNW